MPRRHPETSFIDSLLSGLAEIAQGMAETVADRIVNEFTPIVPPIPKARRETKKPKAETKPRKRETKRAEGETLYSILGVDRKAEPEAVRGAYLALAKKYHADHGAKGQKAEVRMRSLNLAWGTLGSPEKRAAYDRSLSK